MFVSSGPELNAGKCHYTDEVSYAVGVFCFQWSSQECRFFSLPVADGPPVCLESSTLLPQYFWNTPGPLENQTEPYFSSGHIYTPAKAHYTYNTLLEKYVSVSW